MLAAVRADQRCGPEGVAVSLRGSGLTGATAVRFGAADAASFNVLSDTAIRAVCPAGGGTARVTVTGPGGTSNPVLYADLAAPALTSLAPGQGPTSGGTVVTLTGSNLTGATAVAFGAVAAVSFTVVSATQVTATAPQGAAGPVNVTVT
ncbi:IPT/TIG domain-containing protein, partial [Streptomyces sp. NPDC017958]